MADHVWTMIAQGVADALNDQKFSLEAKAERGWRIYKERAEFAEPTITVIPGSAQSSLINRGGARQHVVQMQVLVGRKHDGISGEDDPTAREDPIAGLAQEVKDFLAGKSSQPGAAIEVCDGAVTRLANPTGQVTSEIVTDWLTDGVFAVQMTIEYTLMR